MMNKLQENIRYFWFVFKICLLITLICFVLFFWSWQRWSQDIIPKDIVFSVSFDVKQIPVTIQKNNRPAPPMRPEAAVFVLGEEDEFPEEILMEQNQMVNNSAGTFRSNEIIKQIPAKPLAEKYPDVQENECVGQIKLLLLINKKGEVQSVQVVENTTTNDSCLRKAILAAKQSRWLPSRTDNRPIDSWVTKIYKFNKR